MPADTRRRPDGFEAFAAQFHQDIFEIAPGLSAAVAHALEAFPEAEHAALKADLEAALADAPSRPDLVDRWNASGGDILVDEAEAVDEIIREAIAQLSAPQDPPYPA